MLNNDSHYMFEISPSILLDDDEINKEISKLAFLFNDNGFNTDNNIGSLHTSFIDAGHTYIGQMTVHDIVPSTVLHSDRMEDNVKPVLDLKSIYDFSFIFAHSDYTDDDIYNEYGQFNIENIVHTFENHTTTNYHDLLRYKTGKNKGNAIIPDGRNDENIIVSQLHLLWQKLHNQIVADLFIEKYNKGTVERSRIIEETRKYVVYIFQKILIDEYLYQISDPDVYDVYCVKNIQLFYDAKNPLNNIPYEFARAAFRFGHSMVRNEYITRPGKPVKLESLFLNHSEDHLQYEQLISWNKFFNVNDPHVGTQKAFEINSHLVKTMMDLPDIPAKNPGANSILDINLIAAMKKNIKSGTEIYSIIKDKYAAKQLTGIVDKLSNNYPVYDMLIEEEQNKNISIPLWPYILIEASIENDSYGLGIIGSTIVLDVIMASINTYRESIKNDINKINEFIKDTLIDEEGCNNEFLAGNSACLQMRNIIKYVGED